MYLFHALGSQLLSETLKLRCCRSDRYSGYGGSKGYDGYGSEETHFVTWWCQTD